MIFVYISDPLAVTPEKVEILARKLKSCDFRLFGRLLVRIQQGDDQPKSSDLRALDKKLTTKR
jgi:hypothetical protein